jgi:NitT/TauT family transport system substrate-binding protein
MKSMYDSLKLLDPELTNSNVDLTKTFIDSFAKKAASGS